MSFAVEKKNKINKNKEDMCILLIYHIKTYTMCTLLISHVNYYHCVDTSTGGLLFPDGIIRPVVSVSTRTWFIRYIYY